MIQSFYSLPYNHNNNMVNSSIVSLQIQGYTFIASYLDGIMRITLEINHSEDIIYKSAKFYSDNFPTQLRVLFQNVQGFYQYVYKLIAQKLNDRIIFKNGLLKIKVFIEGKLRSIPIKMKKLVTERQNNGEQPFLLTSIISQNEEQAQSRVSQDWLSKIQKGDYSAPRLKLMMTRENNKFRKAITKTPDHSNSLVSHNTKEYPYLKPQTIHRYNKTKTQENNSRYERKSFSQGKTMYTYQRSLNLKKNMKQNNLDLSNKQLRVNDIKQLVSYEWNKLILLNVGYNNIGNEGMRLLTTIGWASLKTLYACFNNIYKIEWIPANICFVKTLSLSGNKIKQIPKNIIQLQFLQELFIYNNRIQVLPQQISFLEQLKNFSVYGNRLDHIKNRKIFVRLKSRKVQVWQ